MIPVALAAAAWIQQLPRPATPLPSAPPPAPSTAGVRSQIAAVQACYNSRGEEEFKARRAAEDALEKLNAEPGSPGWLAVRPTVLALVTAQRKLRDCVGQLDRYQGSMTDADQAAQDYWKTSFNLDLAGRRTVERQILVRFIDRRLPAADF